VFGIGPAFRGGRCERAGLNSNARRAELTTPLEIHFTAANGRK
jgi:hypothetical protein